MIRGAVDKRQPESIVMHVVCLALHALELNIRSSARLVGAA
jgi:hypothetical protein